MKYCVVAVILISVMLSAFSCGSTPDIEESEEYIPAVSSQSSTASPYVEKKAPVMEEKFSVTLNEALSTAEEYVEDNPSRLASRVDGCSKAETIVIGSSNCKEKFDDHYSIEVKGHFWAYDDHGNMIGKYDFDYTVSVYADDVYGFPSVSKSR